MANMLGTVYRRHRHGGRPPIRHGLPRPDRAWLPDCCTHRVAL